jgi:hypothetical protein
MKKARDEMRALLCDLGALIKQPCTDEENKQYDVLKKQKQELPEDVYPYEQSDGYYRLVKSDLADDEINRLMLLKQTQYLCSIRNCLFFFVVLSVIAIILTLVNLR